ncbi:expressed unknown protein [Seminavis robusta]|uniref:Uncharacterized protein n=1 Tax=Seminavis robusta TaxID=568900 RepID=A0A9N8E3T6_9STRA|nr:expressed unknown protein [Seminavis robusta]|eukprot:Sro473_g150110.1 n/a (97) ;mRNA; f:33496-33786
MKDIQWHSMDPDQGIGTDMADDDIAAGDRNAELDTTKLHTVDTAVVLDTDDHAARQQHLEEHHSMVARQREVASAVAIGAPSLPIAHGDFRFHHSS